MGRDKESGAAVRASCVTLKVADAPGLADARPFGAVDILLGTRAEELGRDRHEQAVVRPLESGLLSSAELRDVGVAPATVVVVEENLLRRRIAMRLLHRTSVFGAVLVPVMAQVKRGGCRLVRAISRRRCNGELSRKSKQKNDE